MDCVLGSNWEPIIINTFQKAIDDISLAGAEIVEVKLGNFDLNDLRHTAFLLIETECAEFLSVSLRKHSKAYSKNLKLMLEYGRKFSKKQLIDAREKLDRVKSAIINLFQDIDFLATPTAPQIPFLHSQPTPINQAEITALANISGIPAISLPYGLTAAGLPLSMQVMAPPDREAELINIAEDLEEIWGRLARPIS